MSAILRIKKPAAIQAIPAAKATGLPASKTPAPAPPTNQFEEYMGRLVKLIPSEVVGIYLIGVGMIPKETKIVVFAIWALACLGLVILVRARLTGDKKAGIPPQWQAVFVSAISYVLWIFTMPGSLQTFGLGLPFVGSLLVLLWTFLIPIFYQGDS